VISVEDMAASLVAAGFGFVAPLVFLPKLAVANSTFLCTANKQDTQVRTADEKRTKGGQLSNQLSTDNSVRI